MTSQKQLQANRRNALKSTGPKTPTGKTLASRNSLKHGLLAKEVVITEGEGAEDQQAFDAVLADLVDQFEPAGSLEEMLVEKIAVCYWRQRRASRFEVGVLRKSLDTVTDDYYGEEGNQTDDEIDNKIEELQQKAKTWQGDHLVKLKKLHEQDKDLSEIYDREEAWKCLNKEILGPEIKKCGGFDGYGSLEIQLGPDKEYTSPEDVRRELYEEGFTDDQIWRAHISLCERNKEVLKEIERLKKDKVKNKLRLQAIKKSSMLPPKAEMDNLLRYEITINRQMDQAIKQLERLQRIRLGHHVPTPIQVDINTLGSGDIKLV